MRSKRLAVVLELMEREKQGAAQAFDNAQKHLGGEQQKLAQLDDYYTDYQTSFASLTHLRAQDLMQQRHFLQQLRQAQQQQQGSVNTAKTRLERAQQAWQKAHLKHKNLAELIQRYRIEEEAALAKKEQKVMDEWATQQARQRQPR